MRCRKAACLWSRSAKPRIWCSDGVHVVVGRTKTTVLLLKVRYSGGMIKAYSNELLMWEGALELFDAFMQSRQAPDAYALRETTDLHRQQAE